nr:unnamed protein product [Spirometra erinaceieuropaei]
MHFRKVLNLSSKIADATIHRLPQLEINVDLNLSPSISEAFCAVQRPSGVKASYSDTIPTESYTHGGHRLVDQLTTLFREEWLCVQVLHRFKDITIVHLYKHKGLMKLTNFGEQVADVGVFGVDSVLILAKSAPMDVQSRDLDSIPQEAPPNLYGDLFIQDQQFFQALGSLIALMQAVKRQHQQNDI